MALETIEKIREAERRADETVRVSQEEVDRLLAETKREIDVQRQSLEKKLREETGRTLQFAHHEAQQASGKAAAASQTECGTLEKTLHARKQAAVQAAVAALLDE